jgi:hypothetical protein
MYERCNPWPKFESPPWKLPSPAVIVAKGSVTLTDFSPVCVQFKVRDVSGWAQSASLFVNDVEISSNALFCPSNNFSKSSLVFLSSSLISSLKVIFERTVRAKAYLMLNCHFLAVLQSHP